MSGIINRIGAARGPNGSTLDDVVDALANITNGINLLRGDIQSQSAALANIGSNLSTLLERVTYLTGSAPPLDNVFTLPGQQYGLPLYLPLVLGTLTQSASTGDNAVGLLKLLWGDTQNLVAQLGTASVLPEGVTSAVRDLLAEVERVGPYIVEPGEVTASSLFALLRSVDTNVADIEACVCDGGSSAPPLNPPPGLCPFPASDNGVHQLRVNGWVRLDPGSVGTARWGAVWPEVPLSAVLAFRDTVLGPSNWRGAYVPEVAVSLCLSWDFTGWSPSGTFQTVRASAANWYSGGSTALRTFNRPQGAVSDVLTPGDTIGYLIESDDTTSPPPNNLFLTVDIP